MMRSRLWESDEESRGEAEEKLKKEKGFLDIIFSWSISDVINTNLYKNKVPKIPKTFSTTDEYLKSFVLPLLEETRADLYSNMSMLSSAPALEVFDVKVAKGYNPPKDLFYDIHIKNPNGNEKIDEMYTPQGGDLIALTDRRPKCIDDLNTPRRPYLIAYVHDTLNDGSHIVVLSAAYIEFKKHKSKLFIVYLANMTTNLRIWAALNSDRKNVNIIKNVLQTDSVGSSCAQCLAQLTEDTKVLKPEKIIRSFNLDDSQKEAVLSVIATMECRHQNTIKLIWGPPGTGKTKTVGSLLFILHKLKCRTLTCAPTNVAVVGVASRLMGLVRHSLKDYPYGLGDIVLFGNRKRMKIDNYEGLSDVFLDNRVGILRKCFSPLTGWKSSLEMLICLLEDPKEQYRIYLNRLNGDDTVGVIEYAKKLKIGYSKAMKLLKEMKEKIDHKVGNILTYDEFFLETFNLYANRLMLYIPSLCTHLPTCLIMLEVAKNMMKVSDLLKIIGNLAKDVVDANKDSTLMPDGPKMNTRRLACLQLLKIIQGTFELPTHSGLRSLCLKNTILIFCTASSSAKLHTNGASNVDLLIVDEAAQLKECESAIPLQLPGLRHVILVGDEKQLPAMVQSKISDKALFGRSLFERLVLLGHTKHLLNVQYRMHPSISQFPNRKFYNNKVKNGPNVKKRTYGKRFLKGNMFGPFSFINVTQWQEDQDNGFSRKNLLEVADLVASLFKECRAKGQKVSVGCISPYKAQVFAIKEKLGSLYDDDTNSDFSVNVNSVDGFQGSEEDVIIISTVRSNGNGSIGFLSNFQRANVALTRARYCCWVLGNEATLLNNGSVWKKLVVDAKRRGFFYNATDNKNLDKAMKSAVLELGHVDSIFKMDSPLCNEAKWKICYSDEFINSMKKLLSYHVREEVLSLLTQLSIGCRCPEKDETVTNATGTCSLLIQAYNVTGEFVLIWTVDIHREHSEDIQVLKVWEILRKHRIPQFITYLNRIFGKYTVDVVNRCKAKQVEGNLLLPMSWPVDANAFLNTDCQNSDLSLSLSSQLAGLSLKNSRGTKNGGSRFKRGHRKW